MTPVQQPRIAGWAKTVMRENDLSARLSGSIFAVAPEHRAETARTLDEAGLNVHVDIIVDAHGQHRGVTPDELRDARAKAPDARIEVHLMLDDVASGDEAPSRADQAIGETIAAAIEARAAVVVLPRAMHGEPAAAVAALRKSGARVWSEVAPHEAASVPDGADGALVMLIRPGTRDEADPGLVARVSDLSSHLAVGVDGGVTPELAERCIAAGATTIVAGRALFASVDSAAYRPMNRQRQVSRSRPSDENGKPREGES